MDLSLWKPFSIENKMCAIIALCDTITHIGFSWSRLTISHRLHKKTVYLPHSMSTSKSSQCLYAHTDNYPYVSVYHDLSMLRTTLITFSLHCILVSVRFFTALFLSLLPPFSPLLFLSLISIPSSSISPSLSTFSRLLSTPTSVFNTLNLILTLHKYNTHHQTN